MKKTLSLIVIILLFALVLAGCGGSTGESDQKQEDQKSEQQPQEQVKFPTQNIRFIIPSGAGGSNDLTVRGLIPGMEKVLGVTVVPENLGASAGAVAAVELSKAKPDGHTLYFNSQTLILNSLTGIDIDLDKFQPLTVVVEDTSAITVPADAPYDTLQEFVDYAKANPGKVKMATNATGALWHLSAATFAKAAGVELQYVPYPSGGAEMGKALAGKEVDASANSPSEVKPLVDAGKLKVLAVQSEERHPLFPDVPTAKEAGIDSSFPVWRGIFVPAGTDEEVLQILEDAIKQSWEGAEFNKFLEANGMPAKFRGYKEFTQFFEDQKVMYEELLEELDLT